MKEINSQNLLQVVCNYYEALGLGTQAAEYFTVDRFSDGMVLKLPQVCVVKKNRASGTTGNQTHIHVTGKNRFFFLSEAAINAAAGSTNDIKKRLVVSEVNIQHLNKKFKGATELRLAETHTMIKLGHGQNKQLQISKLREDGPEFIAMRNGLYPDDLLVFLKFNNNDMNTDEDKNSMMTIGIPQEFLLKANYEFGKSFLPQLDNGNTKTVKAALEAVVDAYEASACIGDDEAIMDAVYQEMVDAAEPSVTTYEPVEYTVAYPEGKDVKTNRPATNPAIGKEAIKDAGYKCSADSTHTTFIKKDGTPYMEVHHLIPLEQQTGFRCKLDTKANLVPLCPLCHKFIHYGRLEDKRPLLVHLYNARKDALAKSGLNITLEDLISYAE